MTRVALLACLFLAGCSSLPERSDYFETQYRGAQALGGDAQAFDRLSALEGVWVERSRRGTFRDMLACEKSQLRAERLADGTLRVVRAKEAILSQRELTEVIVNALVDLESEYDALAAMLVEGEAPAAALGLVAEQKYLSRRMANSLVLMAQTDMTAAVEAADLFGRDVARFQALLDAAINGNDEMGIDPPDNPEVEDSLAQIEELFTGYVADSTGDLLNNVAYRYDAWLALGEMAALGDGRQQKVKNDAPAEKAAATPPADGAGDEPVEADLAGDDAAADAEGNEELPADDGAGAAEDAVEEAGDLSDEDAAAAEDDGAEEGDDTGMGEETADDAGEVN